MSATKTALEYEADNAVREILRFPYQGDRALVVQAPPGSGKTGLTERLAAQSVAIMQKRCMVATQTNEQALELVRRLTNRYSTLPTVLLHRKGLMIPKDLRKRSNLFVTAKSLEVPSENCVVIATSARWSWSQYAAGAVPFQLQIVDEDYQLPD